MRESRTELRKFMRDVKKQNPAANILLQYDKLFVNHRCYVWSDIQARVVEYAPVRILIFLLTVVAVKYFQG